MSAAPDFTAAVAEVERLRAGITTLAEQADERARQARTAAARAHFTGFPAEERVCEREMSCHELEAQRLRGLLDPKGDGGG